MIGSKDLQEGNFGLNLFPVEFWSDGRRQRGAELLPEPTVDKKAD